MNPNETRPAAAPQCASETCARPSEHGEIYCAECGLERSLYFRERRVERGDRDRRGSGSDPRVEALRETARRFFGG
jgi:hypothetical protein